MQSLEHRIPPPLVALVTGVLMWLAVRGGAAAPFAWDARHVGSLVLAGAGLLIAVSGALTFRLAGTTLNPHTIEKASSLVTHGIFRVTRNPMYLGLTVVLTAWAGWLGSPWLLAGPALCALFLNRFQVLPEERVMREKFGQAYMDYCARVGRWI
ncbi:MAG: isoprenylcysteine carboxylmethyltransferase family protein [Gemmatimonadetes bacterium]|nr:isoprenylcysteine carboxylmethyltransferase family protein [Gemmatimonadota bacterium]